MFVINPDSYLLPSYRISPFTTSFLTINQSLKDDDYCNFYFNQKFSTSNWTFTLNGREAIALALKSYNLQQDDIVTIITTSGNTYISSCVTKTIEKFCKWNHEITAKTKILFVNHEFGYPYPRMSELQLLNIPIIEDCCTTFFSQDDKSMIGKYGDFTIYSFPKFFPVQIGGVLVSNSDETINVSPFIDDKQINYIQKVVSFHLKNENELLEKRSENFSYAIQKFLTLGFTLRFEQKQNTVPSVLLLNNNGIIDDLAALKIHFTNYGIQSSVFYGEDVFFIPNHQTLSTFDIDYLYNCILAFINKKV
ncbi:DegT/DnrJ/EryC1/StrS family aminotransferase [Flavobacterium sp. j3]|uniref:DegT/DnrJ/EryC1/StrS family aminotransferase n=1 Tax=Flavobacterium aureirubrum TaxID=3133147 RepID=A0ABU9N2R8_9FLAO